MSLNSKGPLSSKRATEAMRDQQEKIQEARQELDSRADEPTRSWAEPNELDLREREYEYEPD